LFLEVIDRKDEIQQEIRKRLNQIHNVQYEYIEQVFLEMEVSEDHAWRQESGLLLGVKRDVPQDATRRIWGANGFRVFLSHKSEVKKETAALKETLRVFGVSSFVAHEDIHATKAWQDEIENALATMDAFVALMTDKFHDSDWTDQEVGYAVARGVPIIAVRLGSDPYGFIGKFQALTTSWGSAPELIVRILMKNERMFDAYVQALRVCKNWDTGNVLAKALEATESLRSSQIDALVAAYNETSELRGSFGFNGMNPNYYGQGLAFHLNRLGGRKFAYDKDRLIKQVK
jgi:hypothetical protein